MKCKNICYGCLGNKIRVNPNPNADGEYEVCPICKGKGETEKKQEEDLK
jgi:hypothetical protein